MCQWACPVSEVWKKIQRCLGRWGKAVHSFYMLNLTKNTTVLRKKFKCSKKTSKTELQTLSIIACFIFIWINSFQFDLCANSRTKSLGKYDVNVYMLIDIFNQLLVECIITSISLKTKCSTGPSCSKLTLKKWCKCQSVCLWLAMLFPSFFYFVLLFINQEIKFHLRSASSSMSYS